MKSVVLVGLLFALGCCQDAFDQNCLDAHNEYRKRHGAQPMTWSAALATDAQAWADSLVSKDEFKHDYNSINNKSQGENMAYFSPAKPKCMGPKQANCMTCAEIIKDWYDEIKFYDFAAGKAKKKGEVVLHFTQVVWDASVELGVGVGINNDLKAKYGFITVARYSPRGNMGSQADFKAQVFPEVAPGATTAKPGPSTATPTTAGPSSTTQLTAPTLPATGPTSGGKNRSENCEYFIISTTTQEHKIIQKCKGKPNITFVPLQLPLPGKNRPATRLPPAPTAKTTQGPTGQASPTPTTGSTGGSTTPATTPTTPATTPTTPATTPTTIPTTTQTTPTTPFTIPTTPISEQEAKKQEAQATVLSNLYRTMHQVDQLEFDRDLSDAARKWAQKLAQDDGQLTHEPGVAEGENVAAVPKSKTAIMDAFDAWYEESDNYDYSNPKFSKDTGHFTQLVWKDSKHIGIGTATNAKGDKEYVVARFKPAGNIRGQFADNVKPSISP